MEKQLKAQEEDHNEVIYALERKQVVDKDRYNFGSIWNLKIMLILQVEE